MDLAVGVSISGVGWFRSRNNGQDYFAFADFGLNRGAYSETGLVEPIALDVYPRHWRWHPVGMETINAGKVVVPITLADFELAVVGKFCFV